MSVPSTSDTIILNAVPIATRTDSPSDGEIALLHNSIFVLLGCASEGSISRIAIRFLERSTSLLSHRDVCLSQSSDCCKYQRQVSTINAHIDYDYSLGIISLRIAVLLPLSETTVCGFMYSVWRFVLHQFLGALNIFLCTFNDA